VLAEIVSLAARAREAARQRFEAGSAPRLEFVQAELAASQAENDATVARADAAGARSALNVLLGLPLDAQSALTTPLDAGPSLTATDALGRADRQNVEILVLQRRVDEARARIALAHALRAPDLTPEASITRDAEPEFTTGWRAAVAMTIPLFSTHIADVRVEEATLAQAEAEQAAAHARISAEVTSAVVSADARRQQLARYRDEIMPQALEVERMAQDSYTLGQTGIAALLQALQATRDARIRMLQAATDFQESLAMLEIAMGVPLP
jgi:outer membrane protein TolC